jgi:capping protein alpha
MVNEVLYPKGDIRLMDYTSTLDVRNIIADDELLQSGILPALREYNMAQFTVADVPGADIQVCLHLHSSSTQQ